MIEFSWTGLYEITTRITGIPYQGGSDQNCKRVCYGPSEKSMVIVKAGDKADPTKIVKWIRKKIGKHVELISPKIIPNHNKEVKKEQKEGRRLLKGFSGPDLPVAEEGQEIMDMVNPSAPLPPWVTEEDLSNYGALYEKSGFHTALQVPYRMMYDRLGFMLVGCLDVLGVDFEEDITQEEREASLENMSFGGFPRGERASTSRNHDEEETPLFAQDDYWEESDSDYIAPSESEEDCDVYGESDFEESDDERLENEERDCNPLARCHVYSKMGNWDASCVDKDEFALKMWDETPERMDIGVCFKSQSEAKHAVKLWNIHHKREYTVAASSPRTRDVRCRTFNVESEDGEPPCEWKIRVSLKAKPWSRDNIGGGRKRKVTILPRTSQQQTEGQQNEDQAHSSRGSRIQVKTHFEDAGGLETQFDLGGPETQFGGQSQPQPGVKFLTMGESQSQPQLEAQFGGQSQPQQSSILTYLKRGDRIRQGPNKYTLDAHNKGKGKK
ncbi:OLC1v1030674C1 [Oldenlandia corymbosa var. corymbosa]|uniref:OLC1v1030674C1 n=1 Tax=Oldenlandia corymbosa var. corymbosa TaxID=529605 RepID=A0AAV1CHE7_OLDCO|nr:OLC1v1030674C1 [Oldenlandia corymbosa var. corymbosa]